MCWKGRGQPDWQGYELGLARLDPAPGRSDNPTKVLAIVDAEGGTDGAFSVEAIGYRTSALTEAPDFDGPPSPELATLVHRSS